METYAINIKNLKKNFNLCFLFLKIRYIVEI